MRRLHPGEVRADLCTVYLVLGTHKREPIYGCLVLESSVMRSGAVARWSSHLVRNDLELA